MTEVLRKYDQVQSFAASGGNWLVYFKDKRLLINDMAIDDELPQRNYELCRDYVFYTKDSIRTHVYTISLNKQVIFEKRYIWESYIDDVAVFKGEAGFSTVQMPELTVLSDFTLHPGANFTYFKDFIVHTSFERRKRERLFCFDRRSRKYLWEHNVKEEARYEDGIIPGVEHSGEVKAIIGLYGDTLVVAFSGERLVAYQIDTGKQRWRVDAVPEAISPYLQRVPRLPSATNFQLDPVGGRLYSFHMGVYLEIDVATGETSRVINDYDKMSGRGMLLSNYQWYKEGALIYYFTDGSQGTIPQLIAYDVDRREVVWTHVFSDANSSGKFIDFRIMQMQYQNGLFYVLDSNDVLRVLKKSE